MGKIEKMKGAVLSLVFLAVSVTCYSQDECAIYKEAIDEYVLKLRPPNAGNGSKTTITVLSRPDYNHTPGVDDYGRFKDKYEKLSKETFVDFINKSQQTVSLDKITIPNIEFIVLKSDSKPTREELSAKYPNWIYSIVEFSNVGINNARDQALIYYSFKSGPGVGGGIYIVYEKRKKKWKRKAVIPAWAG